MTDLTRNFEIIHTLLDDSEQMMHVAGEETYMIITLESNNKYEGMVLAPDFKGTVEIVTFSSKVDFFNERNPTVSIKFYFNSSHEFCVTIFAILGNSRMEKYIPKEEDMALCDEPDVDADDDE